MLKFFNEINDSIKQVDELTKENQFVTNPFSKVLNHTYVWAEKELMFERILNK